MSDLITIEQLEARLMRTLVEPERAGALAFITDASALAVLMVGDATVTDEWGTGVGEVTPPAIVPALVAMVRRALDNPHGYTSEQNAGYLYQGGKSEGIFATPDEAALIRRAAGKSPIGALTLSVDLPDSRVDGGLTWLDGAIS